MAHTAIEKSAFWAVDRSKVLRGDMEKPGFVRQASPEHPADLPRVCRANLALPVSIMLEDCHYCRRQLAHAAGCPELLERFFLHMANLDCSGAEAMRKASFRVAARPDLPLFEHS